MATFIKSILPKQVEVWLRDLVGSMITRFRVHYLVKKRSEIKIEIGSGPKKGINGWKTMDLSLLQTDLYWDLLKPLPFPEASVTSIYSSHVLEHFHHSDLLRLLSDCYKVLKPGGVFSACVPNAGIYLKGYLDAESFDRSHMGYTEAIYSDLKIDIVNYIAYLNGEHRHMFDEENIVALLRKAGFYSPQLRDFDPNVDLIERRHESIYVRAEKE